MLKEIFLRKLNMPSKTVHNAIITLGDTDDSGKGRKFKSRFLTPGIAGYPGQFGNVLIKKESFDKFINTLEGAPVIINHKDLTEENANDARVGVVSNVWFNDKDGWYWCDGIIWDKTAQNLITDKGWSVSCSYDVKLADDTGGSENNIPYNIEFLDGVFTHLAIVNNPRYERANIVLNSKTVNMVNNTELELFTNAFLEAIEDVVKKNIVNNGWVTLDKVDEDGERIKIWIDGLTPGSHDVLKCIDKHFKLSTKDIKQLRLFNALKEVLNMDKQTIINKKGDTQSEQFWVENYGLGYPTQEGFEKWLETQDEQED